MLRSLDEMLGYDIQALDGEIGKAKDFYFDDKEFYVRYLVVETGGFFSHRRVLISPVALKQPDWELQQLPVELNREEVKNSPEISTDRPVSRQFEDQLVEYYGWPRYWESGIVPAVPPEVVPPTRSESDESAEDVDPNLRSTEEIIGRYDVIAVDGKIGRVEDMIIDDDTWMIHYLVCATRDWLPGKKVLLAGAWVQKIIWDGQKIKVDLTKKAIEQSPEYDPATPVNREFEERLYDFYGRPHGRIKSEQSHDE